MAKVKSQQAPKATPVTSEKAESKELTLFQSYLKNTKQSLRLIDVYLTYIMLSGIIQFVYMLLAGTFPYNAFLAGFISTVGSFVLAVNLRIQTNEENKEYSEVSPVRSFSDFVVCNLILQFLVTNFIG
ncbi:dolichyl-diphosphooligosaccharide--protein glycosyltransferase epsilon subunit [Conidiobolus coronatus NRRL 28638]|uniref:Dolichyl-diphosphooligosaccharide--protein glycosyltransferase subunit OST2 n=1 Tax=Conidiobolus coronatus (strain ATCC 28846 / CBS 209.66 / NRRL 28638) TaxID=796925 RepID=A0A137P002_CONC2|nr:dolichyl-diphosphooligosaccharide--protein glycosyltransferase epsilon subunit [Conidiobolus coronatus NRRL 28638]|eukprot:KXN68347.1 dolichyl-diphosphooligosaccharide--protein glycosyltransferase epsilon subunit [Conidiobolus coronatus NRRL 28638]